MYYMPSNITTEHRKILPEPPVGGLLNRCRTCRCLGEAPWHLVISWVSGDTLW